MKIQKQNLKLLDYTQENASKTLVPNLPTLSSFGCWSNIHFEHHYQPAFEVAEHQHTWHIIAYGYLGGSLGERWLDGIRREERRERGDIAIIPAGISHCCNWNTEAEFTILAIEPSFIKQIGEDFIDGDRIQLIPRFMSEQDLLIQGIFSALRDEIESGKIGGILLIEHLKTALAIQLLRQYCTTKPKLSSYQDRLPPIKLQQVKEYINEHLHQDLKLTELAALVQVSPYHFLRLFKQSMGLTPHQYILQRRIEKARFLLQYSELSIAEVALRVGFCDQSHLTQCFKRIVGITPKQFSRG
ncbi:MAG TPA: AraC family transcriptional regulator [Cyanobacteria bacterium UBA11049]|nr:AraC family transcriptional regulator [Cyanobacteria bacterium UBA11049]